jgi:hypothetical protein
MSDGWKKRLEKRVCETMILFLFLLVQQAFSLPTNPALPFSIQSIHIQTTKTDQQQMEEFWNKAEKEREEEERNSTDDCRRKPSVWSWFCPCFQSEIKYRLVDQEGDQDEE